MADLYVTEYLRMAEDEQGSNLQVPEAPPITTQVVAIGASSVAVTNALTGVFFTLRTDVPCHVNMDPAGSPTATTSDLRLEGGETSTWGIRHKDRGSFKVAVIEA